MKLKTDIELIDPGVKCRFFDAFFAELIKVPFGSLSKRDLECYLIKLFYDNDLIDTTTNRNSANDLGINESRLKTYRIDIRYKFSTDKMAANVAAIIKLLEEGKLKPFNDNDQISFVLEDPILRLDFAQSLKDIGFYSDGSFNSEVVKVRKSAFLALLLKHHENDETLYKKIAKLSKEHEKELLAYLKTNADLREKSLKICEYIEKNYWNLLHAVFSITALVVGFIK